MADRRLGITKKVSLAGVGEGWGDDCYAVVTCASKREFFELADADVKDLEPEQAVDFQNDVVRKHFVRGQVMIVGDDGELQMAAMEAGDIDENIEISTRLFLGITGQDTDPKDLLTMMATSASAETPTTTSLAATSTTETRSSTDSQPPSPPTSPTKSPSSAT